MEMGRTTHVQETWLRIRKNVQNMCLETAEPWLSLREALPERGSPSRGDRESWLMSPGSPSFQDMHAVGNAGCGCFSY